jgi:dicarboxylate transporter 10
MLVVRPSTATHTTTEPLSSTISKTTIIKKASIQSPFWFGGAASCLATFVSHPFDLTKVRLQTLKVEHSTAWSEFKLLSPSRMFKTMWTISRTEGVAALYNGLSASLLRQGTYSTIRFGLYEQFKWSVAGDQSEFMILNRLKNQSLILTWHIRTHCTSIVVLFYYGRRFRWRIW